MVHEQDELDSHSRKRPYPFIHWIQTQSPEPDSKRSPEPESESYKPPLPSPPLLSSKYRSFKSGLDTFGARPGQTENNENAQFDSGKEKVQAGELLNNFRVSQTMSPCLPSNDQYSLKEGPTKRDSNCQRDIETCVNINYDAKSGFKINKKVTRQETLPSDEGQPVVKKSRPSVEITPIIGDSGQRNSPSPDRDMFHKTAAEIVKGRRKYSQSYDESESELYSPYEATTYLPKGRKSPGRQTSPYAKKLNGPGSTHKSNGEAAKIYIQYSNENGSAFAVEKCDKSDNNHNQTSLKIYSENGKSETEMTSFNQGSRLDETLGARARRTNFASSIDSGIRKSVNSDLDSCHSSEAHDEVDSPSLVSKRIPDCGDRERERSRGVTLLPVMSQPPRTPAPSAWPPNTAAQHDKNSSVCRSRKFNTRYPAPEKPRQKRAVIQDMVRPLKQWLLRHRHNPYPTKAEKLQLAVGSKMTLVQVSNWFANARRRLKNVVQEQRCSWSKRLRLYNQCVQGNAELLSISSDDSIWKSEDEDIGDTKSEGGNTEDFDRDEEDQGLQPPEADHGDHDYYDPRPTFTSLTTDTGDLFGDAEPGQENSERGDSSVSTNASPTDSASAGSPGLSPSPTIPDSNKYKKNMLWRYLNDVTEAHQNLQPKDCKSDGESRSSLSESDIPEAVAQEIVYPPASSSPAPASGLWEAGCSVPPASDNITISFTHSPGDSLTKTLVPVISPPSRQDLGVDKVKKHLATSVQPLAGHVLSPQAGVPSGQDGGYGGAQGQVLTLLPPNMRFSSAPATSISYQLPRPAPAIFNPQILRPLSVLPLPGQYPFIMNWNQIALPQIPISQITSLLPLVPDSAVVDTGGQAGQAGQSRWPGDRPGSMSGCGPRGPGAVGAALSAPGLSAETWSSCVTNSGPELDAAVALSQLAHSAPLPPPPPAQSAAASLQP